MRALRLWKRRGTRGSVSPKVPTFSRRLVAPSHVTTQYPSSSGDHSETATPLSTINRASTPNISDTCERKSDSGQGQPRGPRLCRRSSPRRLAAGPSTSCRARGAVCTSPASGTTPSPSNTRNPTEIGEICREIDRLHSAPPPCRDSTLFPALALAARVEARGPCLRRGGRGAVIALPRQESRARGPNREPQAAPDCSGPCAASKLHPNRHRPTRTQGWRWSVTATAAERPQRVQSARPWQ